MMKLNNKIKNQTKKKIIFQRILIQIHQYQQKSEKKMELQKSKKQQKKLKQQQKLKKLKKKKRKEIIKKMVKI